MKIVVGIEKVTSNFILSAEIGNISTPLAAPAINAAPKDVDSVIEDRTTNVFYDQFKLALKININFKAKTAYPSWKNIWKECSPRVVSTN